MQAEREDGGDRGGGQSRSAGFQPVSNLLYRSASSLRTPRIVTSNTGSGGLPIGNRRYSRLETCATTALCRAKSMFLQESYAPCSVISIRCWLTTETSTADSQGVR